MPTLTLTITAALDGVPYKSWVRRITCDEAQPFDTEQAAHGDTTTFTALPGDKLDTVQVLILQPDQAVTVRLDGQTDAGIVLSAGGLLAIVDATIDAGAGAANAKVNNNSGATAVLSGLLAGT